MLNEFTRPEASGSSEQDLELKGIRDEGPVGERRSFCLILVDRHGRELRSRFTVRNHYIGAAQKAFTRFIPVQFPGRQPEDTTSHDQRD